MECKKVKIKCTDCNGNGQVAVGEICSKCWGKGVIEAELVE